MALTKVTNLINVSSGTKISASPLANALAAA